MKASFDRVGRARVAGLTVIEVLIAIVVLSVGVLGAASLQTSALTGSNRARLVQEVTNAARTEMERQRQLSPPVAQCAAVPSPFACTATVVPCSSVQANGAWTLSCSLTAASPIADRVTVRVTGPQAVVAELVTVVAR